MSEISTPTNYHDFRKRFLEAAQKQGLQLHSIQIRGLSPQGRPMFTDIAHSVLNPNLPTLILNSGTHGIEGYLGSTIQTLILEDFDLSYLKSVNVVFIHILNPWGMAWYRRVNGQNIDLNRNYFKPDAVRPANTDFDDYAPLFEKRTNLKRRKIWWTLFKALLKRGFKKSAYAIARGQYHLPESLFYGGESTQIEISEPIKYLKSKLKDAKDIYVIDIHSGLGKFGSENWILDSAHDDKEKDFWQQTLSADLWDPNEEKTVYKSDGNLAKAFRDYFVDCQVYFITQEFGTRSAFQIYKILAQENKNFLKLILDRQRAFLMISAFYPYEKEWRVLNGTRGRESFLKILSTLAKR